MHPSWAPESGWAAGGKANEKPQYVPFSVNLLQGQQKSENSQPNLRLDWAGSQLAWDEGKHTTDTEELAAAQGCPQWWD
eukprot:508839-Rhodomonas_salina.2